ncbi:MAG: hypothetical protein RJA34_2420 [Pseudomonadota bacterium]|jgi:hypothetical protein
MRLLLALFVVLITLTGCAGMRVIDSEVQAASTLPAGTPAIQGHYRFDRLPLQNTPEIQAEAQRMEALAQTALARHGLIRDDAQARYGVQLGARLQMREWRRPGSTSGGPGWRGDWMSHGFINLNRPGAGVGFGMSFPPSYLYQYEISVLIRDLSTHQVMFESRATHEGPWSDTSIVLAALFEAALKDFPNPPAGIRKINIEVTR